MGSNLASVSRAKFLLCTALGLYWVFHIGPRFAGNAGVRKYGFVCVLPFTLQSSSQITNSTRVCIRETTYVGSLACLDG